MDDEGPNYSREGFLSIQDAIVRAVIKLKADNKMTPKVLLQQLPTPPKTAHDMFLKLLQKLYFLILLPFAFLTVNTVRVIVIEKEKLLSQLMKIMGMSSWLQYTSWFLRAMINVSISISLMVMMISVRRSSSQMRK